MYETELLNDDIRSLLPDSHCGATSISADIAGYDTQVCDLETPDAIHSERRVYDSPFFAVRHFASTHRMPTTSNVGSQPVFNGFVVIGCIFHVMNVDDLGIDSSSI